MRRGRGAEGDKAGAEFKRQIEGQVPPVARHGRLARRGCWSASPRHRQRAASNSESSAAVKLESVRRQSSGVSAIAWPIPVFWPSPAPSIAASASKPVKSPVTCSASVGVKVASVRARD